MSRSTRIVAALPAVALFVAAAVACSTTTAGTGTQNGSISASDTPTPVDTSSAPTTDTSTEISLSPSASIPSARSSASQPPTSASTIITPSPSLTGKAQLAPLVFKDAVCSGTGPGSVQVTISWTSTNANQIWIESGPREDDLANADPKTDGNGNPLGNPAKGSVNVSYDCANPEYYYNLTAYNTTNNSKSGMTQKIMRK